MFTWNLHFSTTHVFAIWHVVCFISFLWHLFLLLFFRLFRAKCGCCGYSISSHELVMKALDCVYHLHCFRCVECGQQLQKGEQFVIKDGQIFCRFDFDKEFSVLQFSPKGKSFIIFMFYFYLYKTNFLDRLKTQVLYSIAIFNSYLFIIQFYMQKSVSLLPSVRNWNILSINQKSRNSNLSILLSINVKPT